jgi:lipid-A-disaccharide synthase
LGFADAEKVLLLMPGSRPSELKQHTFLMLNAALLVARELLTKGVLGPGEKLKVLMPIPQTAFFAETQDRVIHWEKEWGAESPLEVSLSQGNSHDCMVAADFGMIKSGTSTLEAGVLGCPHSIVYRPGWLSTWIFRQFIRYRGAVGLVNLVAGGLGQPRESFLLKEILLDDATPENLAADAVSFFMDPSRRELLKQGLMRLKARIMSGDGLPSQRQMGPSQVAAGEILRLVADLNNKNRKETSS